MRIIAGALKGRRLEAPAWEGLRPTSDRLRETLFNILSPRIAGARVLDAYAGTGAVGIEALSRGAAHVTFVERDPRAVRLIEANLVRCGLAPPRPGPSRIDRSERYAIIRAGFAGTERQAAAPPFDVVFLDPPYGAAELSAALQAAAPLAAPDTVVVIEHARRDAAPAAAHGLERVRELVQGDSALGFYRVSRQ